MNMLVYMDIG